MSPFDAVDHPYPLRQQPVTQEQLAAELAFLIVQGNLPPVGSMSFTPALDMEHRLNPRRYAQVLPGAFPLFEFSRAILWLPDEQRIGVLAHEVGHVLAPGTGEDGADMAAQDHLGIGIVYDRRWPGKGLQTAVVL